MSRVEALRIKADYTGIEIEPRIAAETIAKAEVFVQTVGRVFAVTESVPATEYKDRDPKHDDKVSDPGDLRLEFASKAAHLQPVSLEEIRRQARENWLRLRQREFEAAKSADPEHDGTPDANADRSHATDNDVDL